MNSDTFKKQAERLKAYLSKQHRMNLPHSSALNAVASVHGARDWQSLAGCQPEATESRTSKAEAAPANGAYTLTWENNIPKLLLSARDWLGHTVVKGATGACNQWYFDQMAEHARTKRGGVFFISDSSVTPPGTRYSILGCWPRAEPAPRDRVLVAEGTQS